MFIRFTCPQSLKQQLLQAGKVRKVYKVDILKAPTTPDPPRLDVLVEAGPPPAGGE